MLLFLVIELTERKLVHHSRKKVFLESNLRQIFPFRRFSLIPASEDAEMLMLLSVKKIKLQWLCDYFHT